MGNHKRDLIIARKEGNELVEVMSTDSFLQKVAKKRKRKGGGSDDNLKSYGSMMGESFILRLRLECIVCQEKETNGEEGMKWEHTPFSHLYFVKIHCIPGNVLIGLY